MEKEKCAHFCLPAKWVGMVLHKEHLAPLKMGGNSETASEEGKVHRGRRPDEEERPLGEGSLGVNSIDILNFGRKTGLKTGPCSGPNSVLGHSKFRHV